MSTEVVKLTIPQLRVLEVLYQSGGCLSRGRIAKAIDKAQTYVGRVIGYTDPTKRAAFRQTDLGKSVGVPLLDRDLVIEHELDIDGITELAVEITEAGREAYLGNRLQLKQFVIKKATKEEENEDESDNREERISDSDSNEQEADSIDEW